jgi:hypothetical protein
MKKLKTFFYVFKNSVTSPRYYNDILKTDIWFSIKYFLMLSFFASLLLTVFLSIVTIPQALSGLKSISQDIKNIYPEDLEITFKEGSWETNREEPVIVPMPDLGEESTGYVPQNLVVFDKEGTIDKIEEYDALVLLNGENIIYRGEGEVVTSRPLNTIPDVTLNKETVDQGINNLYKYLKFLPYVLPLGILIFVFVFNYLGGALFYIIFIALVLYVITLITKNKIGLINSIKIAAHAMTIPLILQIFTIFLPEINSFLPGWFFILSTGITIYFTFKMREEADLKKIEK